MRVLENASVIEKTRSALRLLMDKASGRYPGKQVWFGGLRVPAYEFTVKLGKGTEPHGASNGSQPIRSETNSTSSAAVSRR